MPTFYRFRENGVDYSFDDVFIPADLFRYGNLWNWGRGLAGALGNYTGPSFVSTPTTTFAGGSNWKQVSTGGLHTVAIKTDGTLWTWGNNSRGQLGDASTTSKDTPVTTFAGGTTWQKVEGGCSHTAAIKTDGTLWVWGNGRNGQLGFHPDDGNRLTPVTTFAGGTNWADTATTEPEDLYTLSVGNDYTAAIKTDGTLWLWGLHNTGRLGNTINNFTVSSTPVTTFAGGTNWRQVSAGDNYAAAIKTDGTLWLWGSSLFGTLGNRITTGDRSTPVTTFAGGTNWKQVSAGNLHTAAIKTDGTLWTWGDGDFGKLATNGVSDKSTPVTTFAGGTNWKQVSAGIFHTAAIKTDGTLWTWGRGNGGQLANGILIIDVLTPITTFAGGTDWKQVSTGRFSTAAIKTDGTLWTWGGGSAGELGNNDITNRSTPVTTFSGGTNWKQVSIGYDHIAAIKTDGTLWTWGFGNSGRLGTNDITSRSTPVTTFAGGTNWKQVSTGTNHTTALKDDGINKELFVFGNGYDGQLGNAVVYGFYIVTPVTTFAGGTNWKQVATGYNHTSAIKLDGTLWTWGSNFYGSLGANDITNRSTPVTTFAGGTDWKQVSCGYDTTAALKTDGTLWTWGYNYRGQLGNADITNRSTPVTTFAGGTDWKQVSSGGYYTVHMMAAIKTDGTLWVWGNSYSGVLGNGINLGESISTPITTFAGGSNWKQVSCGGYHMSAIKNDGTLWTWGSAEQSQLGEGSDSGFKSTPITTFLGGSNWKVLGSSVGYRVCAIQYVDDPLIQPDLFRLFTWGYGIEGSLGNGIEVFSPRSTPITTFAGGSNWKQISVGQFKHGAGIKTDGTLWVWGNGYAGKLGTNDLINRLTPTTTFAGGNNWRQVSCGGYYTAAIKTDGTLWTWGYGYGGVLGNASTTNRLTPVTTFAGGNNWKEVNCGYRHTAAIKTDGTLWLWGFSGNNGALGNNTNFGSASTPVTTFAGGNDWKQVSCGYQDTTAAIKTDGTLWIWGDNNGGTGLGINSSFAGRILTPVTTFAGGNNWKQVSAGGRGLTTAIKTDGTLWIWGFGSYLGVNNTNNVSTPVTTFAGGTDWREVSSGTSHTVAIKTDGTLWTWGDNDLAKLGTNDDISKLTPVTTFAGGSNWQQVRAGAKLSGAITKN